MIILGLDTANRHCTAALVKDGRVLASNSEDIGRGHAERLAPMVSEIMSAATLDPADIEQVAVCTGPGSFTGLRVALAFAKGFALPRSTPVIGVSALECLAVQADASKKYRVASIMDVRRGQATWAVYDRGHETSPPITQDIKDARAAIAQFGCDMCVGDGVPLLGMESPFSTVVDGPALCRLSVGRSPSLYPATPLYSRGPDAKLPGGISP